MAGRLWPSRAETILRTSGSASATATSRTSSPTTASASWIGTCVASAEGDAPFALFCHHKAPHRSWEPDEANQHVYDDVEIAEPETFWGRPRRESDVVQACGCGCGCSTSPGGIPKAHPPAGLSVEYEIRWRYQRYIRTTSASSPRSTTTSVRCSSGSTNSGSSTTRSSCTPRDPRFFLGDYGRFNKPFMYEESLNMPFLVRYLRLIQPRRPATTSTSTSTSRRPSSSSPGRGP